MGLGIAKRYSNGFDPISVKLYENIGYHGGTQAVTFLGNRPSLKKCDILKFQRGSQWNNPTCAIS